MAKFPAFSLSLQESGALDHFKLWEIEQSEGVSFFDNEILCEPALLECLIKTGKLNILQKTIGLSMIFVTDKIF